MQNTTMTLNEEMIRACAEVMDQDSCHTERSVTFCSFFNNWIQMDFLDSAAGSMLYCGEAAHTRSIQSQPTIYKMFF